ncbi:MAG: hypothetical protein PHY90_10385 [Desulfitobacteriaceae bacterium]|nr:hypothetical protein [Desulfitobacteriaceae bacterium]
MQISKEYKIIVVNAFISLFAVILASFLTYYFAKNSEIESRQYNNNKESLKVVLQDAIKYSDYNLVDWEKVRGLYTTPYHCDWKNNPYLKDKLIDSYVAQNETMCPVYEELQNAKKDFRMITTEARVIGSEEVLIALKDVEDGFDEVFLKMASEPYYMRIFYDKYDEVMPERFAKLESSIRNDTNK